MDKKELRKVLNHYGLKPQSISKVSKKSGRQVWRVVAGDDVYSLKYLGECQKAQRMAAASAYLNSRGIPVMTMIAATDGEPLVSMNKGCFLLSPWIKGVRPRYDDPGIIEKITVLMARFHEASRGFAGSGYPVSDSRLEWYEYYQKKMANISKILSMAYSMDTSFSRLFLSSFSWIYSRIRWVLDNLPQSSYDLLVEIARQDPLLGHGDYSRVNILLDQQGEMTIIDLDTISVSLPIWDISRLVTWINHDLGDWSQDRFRGILQHYGQVRPLTTEEVELLQIDQVFPSQALRLAKHYFKGRRTKTMLEEFERCLAIDRQKLSDLGLGPQ